MSKVIIYSIYVGYPQSRVPTASLAWIRRYAAWVINRLVARKICLAPDVVFEALDSSAVA